MRVIVCAANELKNGIVVLGVRHYDQLMMRQLHAMEMLEMGRTGEQGFVDNKGEFLTREEALVVATEAGQINTRREKGWPEHMLFSEDLY